jgi:hypothetical protein
MRTALSGAASALVALAVAGSATPSRAASDVHFRSPSGNINCILTGTYADCVVRHAAWPRYPAKPATCDLDWSRSEIEVFRSSVRVGSCRGDIGPLCVATSGFRCRILEYGQSVAPGAIRCSSSTAGVTCRYRTGRRVGFRVSREGYTLYR